MSKKQVKGFEKAFPKGMYYIGDPCYVISNDNWNKLLEDTNYFENEEQSYKGYPILVDGTKYGDGAYHDNYGREYLVDSGTIGIIPFEAIDIKNNIENFGAVVTFQEDFVSKTIDGLFKFDNIVIDTDYSYDWEAEEDDEIYYDYDYYDEEYQ